MKLLFIILLFILPSPGISQGEAPPKLLIVGANEKVGIKGTNLLLHSKLAPSFRDSYLHATEIKKVKKNKERYIKFKVTDRYGHTKNFNLKRADQDETAVVINFCIAGKLIPEKVFLVNREDKEEEVLLGKSALAGEFVINPASSYTLEPNCPES